MSEENIKNENEVTETKKGMPTWLKIALGVAGVTGIVAVAKNFMTTNEVEDDFEEDWYPDEDVSEIIETEEE